MLAHLYSPKCLIESFSELRLEGVLGTSSIKSETWPICVMRVLVSGIMLQSLRGQRTAA